MGTKQVKMEFQVAANDGELAQVTITAGGTQVFSGSLAQTENPLPGQVLSDSTPFSLVEFELNVDDMPVPPGTPDSNLQWVTSTDITIAVSGGSICLQETQANYSATWQLQPDPNPWNLYEMVPGNSTTFATLKYAMQPVWTPSCVGRLDIADNVDTGAGSLLLLDNESVAYRVAMTLYSA